MFTNWDAVSTLDRMLDDVMGSALGTATSRRTFEPSIDVRSDDAAIVFEVDVPGVKQEDLDITLDKHVLTIKGARKFESNDKQQVLLGRAYGAFSRAFTLPSAIDESKLEAKLDAGVLTIRIAKVAKALPRKIQIGSLPK